MLKEKAIKSVIPGDLNTNGVAIKSKNQLKKNHLKPLKVFFLTWY